MVLVTGNWRIWLVGSPLRCSSSVVVYFTVIKPDQNTANQALKSGLQQTQQAINQAQKELSSATKAQGGQAAGSAQGEPGHEQGRQGQRDGRQRPEARGVHRQEPDRYVERHVVPGEFSRSTS